ncbi:hypothetical protein [Polymorphobacter megasporae]|uniref:hypothetical protein n=1 Tax=Glacieibacterium megasporae TaxID=2835787 RepID=UPI001C1E8883|nr:hypothetical protein [Polymorphobacter megasporae]UAJ09137.1 hypothetical protein KTC28_12360 [Polymorphobacter megasporae]
MSIDITQPVTLTKRSVARNQIDAAVHQIFVHKNYVAANTLSLAAAEILESLAKIAGKRTMFTEFYDRIQPEHLKTVKGMVKDVYNFSKHADRDAHQEITGFKPQVAIMNAWMEIVSYGVVYNQRSPEMFVLYSWLAATNPRLVKEDSQDEFVWARHIFGDDHDMEVASKLCSDLLTNRSEITAALTAESKFVEA